MSFKPDFIPFVVVLAVAAAVVVADLMCLCATQGEIGIYFISYRNTDFQTEMYKPEYPDFVIIQFNFSGYYGEEKLQFCLFTEKLEKYYICLQQIDNNVKENFLMSNIFYFYYTMAVYLKFNMFVGN